MDETELQKFENQLNILLKNFKMNTNSGDAAKLKIVQAAKLSIRRISLMAAIRGNLKLIEPFQDPQKGLGWRVIDSSNKELFYF